MFSFAITTGEALLIVRPGMSGPAEQHLLGKRPGPVAVDPRDPSRLYVGTLRDGLWRSRDAGRKWEPAGSGIPHAQITAVAVGHNSDRRLGIVYAGTEPSSFSRSEDGGDSWATSPGLLDLPSASRWSFPPKPETHHVRWIEVDPNRPGRLYVAIEAGALVRSDDHGQTWQDRVPGGPIDTHTAASHRAASGYLYSAAGDGYFESQDSGESWKRPMEGLHHRYMVGVAVDPADPGLVIVSGAAGPYDSYRASNAEAYLYRKADGGPFELAMEGLPAPGGTVASRLASHPEAPGAFFAANNHGLFRLEEGAWSWVEIEVEWPDGSPGSAVDALAVFTE